MAETHPNAYLQEAREKRTQAAALIAQAESFEAKARELDPSLNTVAEPADTTTSSEEPMDGEKKNFFTTRQPGK